MKIMPRRLCATSKTATQTLQPLPQSIIAAPSFAEASAPHGFVQFTGQPLGAGEPVTAAALRLMLSDSRSPDTRRAYEADLKDFCKWAGVEFGPGAVAWLCGHDATSLARLLNGYRADLRERVAEATTNRRLSALRALLRKARQLGADVPDPTGLVKSEKVTPYRDVRGPELSEAAQILLAPDRASVQGKRDYALLLLLAENALRRGEVTRCDLSDFEPETGRLWIIGKGQGTQKQPVTLSAETVSALTDYLEARKAEAGGEVEKAAPLFASCGKGSRAEADRLTGRGIAYIVNRYGEQTLGRSLHPHQLRHTAITAVLQATNGDVVTAQKLSRHKDVRTLLIYNDARTDAQGAATRLLSELLKSEKGKAQTTGFKESTGKEGKR